MEDDLPNKGIFRDMNEVIPYVGAFGRYQQIVTFIFCIMMLPIGNQILLTYFSTLNSPWKCSLNSSVCVTNRTFSVTNTERCRLNRSEWEFTKPRYFSIRTEFDIYCDQEWLVDLMTSVFFLAWAVGAGILGYIADNYGRKIVLFPSAMVVIFVGFISIFSPNLPVLVICRAVIGFFVPGVGVQMLVMASEIVSTQYRPITVTLVNASLSVGFILLGVQAYYIQEWKLLSVVASTPYFFVVLFYKFVPESVRWLHVHNKIDKLTNQLHKFAYWNKKVILRDVTILPFPKQRPHVKVSPLDLFNTRRMALQSLNLAFCWFVNGMCFYGITLLANDLGGSLYTNFVLLSAFEVPGNLMAIYLCESWLGRKKTTIVSMVAGSVSCMAVGLIPDTSGVFKITRITLGIMGKLCITLSFGTIYVWSLEIYATDIRAQGMGFLQIASRIGAASSPWFIDGPLKKLYFISPFVLMGAFAFLSALLLVFLPETKGKPVQDSSKDVDSRVRVQTMENCGLLKE